MPDRNERLLELAKRSRGRHACLIGRIRKDRARDEEDIQLLQLLAEIQGLAERDHTRRSKPPIAYDIAPSRGDCRRIFFRFEQRVPEPVLASLTVCRHKRKTL